MSTTHLPGHPADGATTGPEAGPGDAAPATGAGDRMVRTASGVPLRWLTRRTPGSTAVLLVASFGAFLAFLDSTIVNVAFPDIQASFPHSSLSSLSWVLNAYNIVLASLLVAAGRFADLVGRRRMFVVGVVVFTVSSVLCAGAGGVGQLIAFRVLQGVGAAMLIPASLALVVQGFDLSRRAHGVGLWGAAAAIASGLGPPMGGALVAAYDWRLAFLVNLPLGVLAVVCARRYLVESRSPGVKRRPDLRGALLLGVCLGLLTTALIKGPDWGWASPETIGALIGSAVGLVGFVLSSRSATAPLIDPALVRIRSFSVGNLTTVVAGAGFYGYLLTHILYLSYVWHYGLFRAGLAVAPAAFIAAVVASRLGKVADVRGHRIILVPGALIWAASLLWYLERVGPTPAFLTEWLPGQVIQGIGVGATLPVLASAALSRLPKGDGYATASAVNSSARQLGAVLGVAFLVILVGTPDPLHARASLQKGWVFAAVCFTLAALGCALIGRTIRAAAADPTAPEAVDDAVLPPPAAEAAVAPPALDLVPLPDTLGELPMFAGLAPAQLEALERAAEDVELEAGSYLFHQGDPSDALYVLRSGRLQVVQGEVVLTELARGAVLGELGLLTDDVRSASIRAVRDSRLLRLSKDQFDAMADLRVMTTLARGLAQRIQEIAPPASSRAGTDDVVVAVVGLDGWAPVRTISAALVDHMAASVRVVDPGVVDREGLERAERSADTVVLTADATDRQGWRDFCLRVADRVVMVAGEPQVPTALHSRALGCDLVLTGEPSREQRAEWFAALEPRSTHEVRPGAVVEGTRPLAARLTGRSLGLVLGGGGARGFAHLGVLEVLEAHGFHVDRIAGTSMGSVIGGLAATGMGAAATDAYAYEYFVRNNPLGDYTVPTKSLIRGRRTTTLLEEAFAGWRIEAMAKEFRCVSVDLLRRRRQVHDRGPAADAVGASLRIPGLFPPVQLEGSLHVDGGVLDNLPVRTLDRSEGPLVAVNIGLGGDSAPAGAGPVELPGLGDTLLRTLMLASGNATDEAIGLADLVISPDATGVGLLEWHQIDRMREAGRAAAEAALPQLHELVRR